MSGMLTYIRYVWYLQNWHYVFIENVINSHCVRTYMTICMVVKSYFLLYIQSFKCIITCIKHSRTYTYICTCTMCIFVYYNADVPSGVMNVRIRNDITSESFVVL